MLHSQTALLDRWLSRSPVSFQMAIWKWLVRKKLRLNNGNEYVRVKGIVRPEDISATNIVSSTRLADAQIRYTGSGHLADASKPGWLSQFMRAISPF